MFCFIIQFYATVIYWSTIFNPFIICKRPPIFCEYITITVHIPQILLVFPFISSVHNCTHSDTGGTRTHKTIADYQFRKLRRSSITLYSAILTKIFTINIVILSNVPPQGIEPRSPRFERKGILSSRRRRYGLGICFC